MVIGAGLLQFPTDYPLKVLGRPSAQFRTRVHGIMLSHVPDLDAVRIRERLSANGSFVAISYVIRATSREQVIALAAELSACEEVMMVL